MDNCALHVRPVWCLSAVGWRCRGRVLVGAAVWSAGRMRGRSAAVSASRGQLADTLTRTCCNSWRDVAATVSTTSPTSRRNSATDSTASRSSIVRPRHTVSQSVNGVMMIEAAAGRCVERQSVAVQPSLPAYRHSTARKLLTLKGPITIAIRARYEHDTLRYEVFRALAYEIDSSTPRESVVGVSCMLIDSSIFTLYLYRPTLHRVCEYARNCLYKRN